MRFYADSYILVIPLSNVCSFSYNEQHKDIIYKYNYLEVIQNPHSNCWMTTYCKEWLAFVVGTTNLKKAILLWYINCLQWIITRFCSYLSRIYIVWNGWQIQTKKWQMASKKMKRKTTKKKKEKKDDLKKMEKWKTTTSTIKKINLNWLWHTRKLT